MSATNSVSLGIYTLRVRELNSGSDIRFRDLPMKEEFIAYLEDKMRIAGSSLQIVGGNRAFLSNGHKKTNRALFGQIQTGRFGYGSKITNIKTGKVAYERTKDDADMIPLFFRCEVHPSEEFALFVFQNFNNHGLKDAFSTYLSECFSEDYPELRLHWQKVATQDVAQSVLSDGIIKKARLIRHLKSSDVADAYRQGTVDGAGEIELQIRAVRGGSLNLGDRISEFLSGKRELKTVIEFEEFEYDDIKVELEVNGVKRTLPLMNVGSFSPDYDITDDVELDLFQHPTPLSVDNIAASLIESVRKSFKDEHKA